MSIIQLNVNLITREALKVRHLWKINEAMQALNRFKVCPKFKAIPSPQGLRNV